MTSFSHGFFHCSHTLHSYLFFPLFYFFSSNACYGLSASQSVLNILYTVFFLSTCTLTLLQSKIYLKTKLPVFDVNSNLTFIVRKAQSLHESSHLPSQVAKDITEFGRIRNNLIHNVNCTGLSAQRRKIFIEKYESAVLQLNNIAKEQ